MCLKHAEWEVWLLAFRLVKQGSPGFRRDDLRSLFKSVTLRTNYFVY